MRTASSGVFRSEAEENWGGIYSPVGSEVDWPSEPGTPSTQGHVRPKPLYICLQSNLPTLHIMQDIFAVLVPCLCCFRVLESRVLLVVARGTTFRREAPTRSLVIALALSISSRLFASCVYASLIHALSDSVSLHMQHGHAMPCAFEYSQHA